MSRVLAFVFFGFLRFFARILAFCVNNESMSGPVNAVSPQSLTNREFTKGLGAFLNRPTVVPMPKFLAKIALGEMAEALLLASTRVVPKKLQQAKFAFDHPTLAQCLQHELGSTSLPESR